MAADLETTGLAAPGLEAAGFDPEGLEVAGLADAGLDAAGLEPGKVPLPRAACLGSYVLTALKEEDPERRSVVRLTGPRRGD